MHQQSEPMPPLSELKPISQFAELLNATPTTIQLWIRRGVNRGTVRLKAWRVSDWRTTERHVLDFIERRTNASMEAATAQPVPVKSQSHKDAVARLAKRGVGVSRRTPKK